MSTTIIRLDFTLLTNKDFYVSKLEANGNIETDITDYRNR